MLDHRPGRGTSEMIARTGRHPLGSHGRGEMFGSMVLAVPFLAVLEAGAWLSEQTECVGLPTQRALNKLSSPMERRVFI